MDLRIGIDAKFFEKLKSPSLFANFRFARFLFVSAACLSFPIASARAANPEATATPTPDPVEEKVNALRDKAKSTADMVEAEDEGVKLWDKELNQYTANCCSSSPISTGTCAASRLSDLWSGRLDEPNSLKT
jgi:hypothetical protein